MDLLQLPKNAAKLQLRMLRLPLTVFEVVTERRGDTGGDQAEVARRGLVESTFGAVKEVTGIVLGNDDLVAEGRLQQAKADHERDAAVQDAVADQKERRAQRRYAAKRQETARRRAEVEQEEAERTAKLEAERSRNKSAVDHAAQQREAAVERTATAKKVQAQAKKQRAQQERATKAVAASRREEAAEAARERAETLRKAREADS